MSLFDFVSKTPLTVRQLIDATDDKRVHRADTEIIVDGYTYDIVIKKQNLWNRIKSSVKSLFGIRQRDTNTAFIRLTVFTHNLKNRHTHTVVLMLPYLLDMDLYKLESLPVQCYSTTEDFKYRWAYALHQTNNLYLDINTKEALGIATTQPPKIRNPSQHKQFDKHLYHVISNINKVIID